MLRRFQISQGRGANTRVADSARAIVPYLLNRYAPAKVVDVGCGDGTWLAEFPLSITRIGLDRHTKVIDNSMNWYHRVDFTTAYTIPTSDLALCLELAEHLDITDGERLVAKLCQTAPQIVWSAAIPGQGGSGHKNEQWPSYWAGLFALHGYYPDTTLRTLMWSNTRILPWYHHILIYTKTKPQQPELLDIGHPSMFNLRTFSRLCSLITQHA